MKVRFKRIIKYYKPYKGMFIADMIFAIISAIIALILPFMVRYVIQHFASQDPTDAIKNIIIATTILLALVIFQFFCNYYVAYIGHVMGAKIEYDMRSEIFGHYQDLPYSFYDNQKTGQLLSRITSDLFDITEFLHHGPENIIISAIRIVGAFIIMMLISPPLALISYAIVPVILIFAYIKNKKMKKAFKENRVKIGDINAQIEDSLSGIRVVKAFSNENLEEEKFKIGNDAFLAAKKETFKSFGGYNSGLKALIMLMKVVVMAAGGIMASIGFVQISDLLAFFLYINVLIEPIRQMADFTEMFQNGYSGFERFCEIMDIDVDIKDRVDAINLKNVKGEIEFKNTSFTYGKNQEGVLNDINLKVPNGAYYAIVGPSGIGKTTLVNLIPRFYEISGGSITIDGIDIRDVTQASLRGNIGMVQQDVYLFMGTVYENILYAKPNASKEEVIAAAKNANAHDFIMELPNGYDTDIGQRGVKLSGGQKQRLSIARVFLKNPPILIFDEATSALDNESEKIVQESMDKLAKNRTTLVIAHRLSTVRNADKILVMSKDGIKKEDSKEFFRNLE